MALSIGRPVLRAVARETLGARQFGPRRRRAWSIRRVGALQGAQDERLLRFEPSPYLNPSPVRPLSWGEMRAKNGAGPSP